MTPVNAAAVAVETCLPDSVAPYRPAAIFAYGSAPSRPLVTLDDAPAAVTSSARAADGRVRWWGVLRVPGLAPGEHAAVRAGDAPVVTITAGSAAPTAGGAPAGRRLAICMTTFEPNENLFRAQIESIRAQSHDDWHCVVVDDCSGDDAQAMIARVLAGDQRFTVHHMERRLGFYGNFERALGLVPADAELIALADHDDRWHPDKLATLEHSLGDGNLVYSDMRLIAEDGTVHRETLWKGRRNNFTDLTSMLTANTVTGAAAMFRRDLLDIALPFPGPLGVMFHDHWLACCALSSGEVSYVDRPLYDYVQHPGAVFGEVSSGRSLRRPAGATRAAYFYGYLGRVLYAVTLLDRGGERIAEADRARLERFVAAERSVTCLAALAARGARHRLGTSATLGSEREIIAGILWRHRAVIGAARDLSLPDPLAAQQRRLRHWRAAL